MGEVFGSILVGFIIWFLVRYGAAGLYTVDQNERAVKTKFGRADRIAGATTLPDRLPTRRRVLLKQGRLTQQLDEDY